MPSPRVPAAHSPPCTRGESQPHRLHHNARQKVSGKPRGSVKVAWEAFIDGVRECSYKDTGDDARVLRAILNSHSPCYEPLSPNRALKILMKHKMLLHRRKKKGSSRGEETVSCLLSCRRYYPASSSTAFKGAFPPISGWRLGASQGLALIRVCVLGGKVVLKRL